MYSHFSRFSRSSGNPVHCFGKKEELMTVCTILVYAAETNKLEKTFCLVLLNN